MIDDSIKIAFDTTMFAGSNFKINQSLIQILNQCQTCNHFWTRYKLIPSLFFFLIFHYFWNMGNTFLIRCSFGIRMRYRALFSIRKRDVGWNILLGLFRFWTQLVSKAREDVIYAENIPFELFSLLNRMRRKTLDDRSLANKATDCHSGIGAGVVFVSSRKSHLRTGAKRELSYCNLSRFARP